MIKIAFVKTTSEDKVKGVYTPYLFAKSNSESNQKIIWDLITEKTTYTCDFPEKINNHYCFWIIGTDSVYTIEECTKIQRHMKEEILSKYNLLLLEGSK